MNEDSVTGGTPTWAMLVEREPGLTALETAVREIRPPAEEGRFCANEVWAHAVKPILRLLVGHHRRPAPLIPTVTGDEGERMRKRWGVDEYTPTEVAERDERSRQLESVMGTSAAWDVAYRHLYEQMPGCGKCWCT